MIFDVKPSLTLIKQSHFMNDRFDFGYRYLFTSGRMSLNKDVLEYESSLEKNFLQLLSFDSSTKRIQSQPFTIKWYNCSLNKRYTPDVLLERILFNSDTGSMQTQTIVFEVKPRNILISEWQKFAPRFKIATKWCKERGYFFKLVTEKYIDTPYLANVNFLLQYDQSRFPISTLKTRLDIEYQVNDILMHQPLSVNELLQSISSDKTVQLRILPYVWLLIRHGKLNANLTVPLTMKTIVWNGEPPFDYNFEQSPIRRRLRSRIITP